MNFLVMGAETTCSSQAEKDEGREKERNDLIPFPQQSSVAAWRSLVYGYTLKNLFMRAVLCEKAV